MWQLDVAEAIATIAFGALVLLAVLDAMDADAYVASESDILQGMALGIGAPV